MGSCAFDALFARSVPHILERIFFALDFDSFEACSRVNQAWEELFCRSYAKMFGEKLAEMLAEKQRNERQLWIAARMGNVDEVRRVISSGGKMDVDCMRKGYTPLHEATINGCKEIVRLLLDRGADPNKETKFGETPLHYAIQGGHERYIQLIYFSGSFPKKLEYSGIARRKWSTGAGFKWIKHLLANRGNPEKTRGTHLELPKYPRSLRKAVRGYEEVIKLLLERGADSEAADTHGSTLMLHEEHLKMKDCEQFFEANNP